MVYQCHSVNLAATERTAVTARLDAHHHLWDPAHRPCPWWGSVHAPIARRCCLDELAGEMSAHGMHESVVVECFADIQETLELLTLARDTPSIAGVVGWADLASPGVADMVAMLREKPGGTFLVGLRHPVHEEPDADWLVRGEVLRGLRVLAAAGLAFDLLVRPRELATACRVAEAVPELRLVVDHLGKPIVGGGADDAWRHELTLLASHENVSCKLSGLVTQLPQNVWHDWDVRELLPYAAFGLDVFGPGRVMFGSDWPVCLLAGTYGQVVELAELALCGLDQAEQSLVLGGTARQVYQLSGGTS